LSGFAPLKAEAESRGKAIQALMGGGPAHRPTAAQGCSALTAFAGAMQKMAEYVEVNSARCSIPPEVGVQIKEQHEKLESQRKQVCDIVAQQRGQPPDPQLPMPGSPGDVLEPVGTFGAIETPDLTTPDLPAAIEPPK